MTRVADESRRAYDMIERIETLERIAATLPDQDERRLELLDLVEKDPLTTSWISPEGADFDRPRCADDRGHHGLPLPLVSADLQPGHVIESLGLGAQLV
jgi:hypothetical protein